MKMRVNVWMVVSLCLALAVVMPLAGCDKKADAPKTGEKTDKKAGDKKADKKADIVTPVVQLDWTALDALRQAKITTPFSFSLLPFSVEFAIFLKL